MPTITQPPGMLIIPLVTDAVNVGTSITSYEEVLSSGRYVTRVWLNAQHIPAHASVYLVVRAYSNGLGNVRLAIADAADVSDSEVNILDATMETPPMSADIRANLDALDDYTLYCLEAETDGSNILTIHSAWLLAEW